MAHKSKIAATIRENTPLNHRTRLIACHVGEEIARLCRPGQFFNVRPLESTAPLLRRPISICDARTQTGEIDFLVQTVGEGTRLIAGHPPGAAIDIIGPLGHPFDCNPDTPALMIAGGVGVAPLHFLARHIRNARPHAQITFCYGARSQTDFVLLPRIENIVSKLVLTTEDASRGAAGYVTDAARQYLAPGIAIFVCGPTPMMNAALQLMRERGLEGQLSLENIMGCGVGACQGCVVPTRQGHLRVCCDGPVVPSQLLDRLIAH